MNEQANVSAEGVAGAAARNDAMDAAEAALGEKARELLNMVEGNTPLAEARGIDVPGIFQAITNMVEGNTPLAEKLLEELKARGIDVLGGCGDPDCPSCGSGRLEGIPGIPLEQFRGIPGLRITEVTDPLAKLELRVQAIVTLVRTFNTPRAQVVLAQLEGVIGAALMQGPAPEPAAEQLEANR
jgi:hypothetical protein